MAELQSTTEYVCTEAWVGALNLPPEVNDLCLPVSIRPDFSLNYALNLIESFYPFVAFSQSMVYVRPVAGPSHM